MLVDMSEQRRPSLEIRVTALEWEVRQLRAELIRAKTAGERPTSPMPPFAPVVEARLPADLPPPSETPDSSLEPTRAPTAAASPGVDLETLVGRYGMLGLATMLALAALGTFVSWAIARGLLGPTTRVVLGLVAAVAIGVAGLKLRTRSRSFGDSLLALALAAVHVCAWAAGPSMGLVPAPLALGCSAAASVALGAFALIEADEPLWCVGFGGACIAPFVTSTGQGTAPMLAAYATGVLVAAGSGLASRPWFIAGRVFAAGATLGAAVLYAFQKGNPGFTMGEWALGSNGWGPGYLAGYNTTSAFLTEAILTFLFLFVIFATTSKLGNSTMAGLAIGLCLVLIHLVAIHITGTSVNPARSFGPAIFAGGKALGQLWLFIVAPLVGGIAAALLWMGVFEK